ncbi:S8 family serine peptidase [Pseudidiomarina sp.]|uniref:S8 family serine peptidase n=1 Tax=Pseudidiomarina sp. TaxID=2081707 RepID=UPI003A98661D
MNKHKPRFAKSALATFTALYVAGISAATLPDANQSKVDRVYLNSKSIAADIERQNVSLEQPSLLENDGRNVKLRAPKKFIAGPANTKYHGYIIRLRQAPAALQTVKTRSGKTEQLFSASGLGANTESPLNKSEVRSYVEQLKQEQVAFASEVQRQTGIDLKIDNSFQIAINGVVSTLREDEARRIASMPQVASVRAVQEYELLTDENHVRIGTKEAWNNTQFGSSNGLTGEGLLVGVIDTGINPHHPSFAATGDDGYTVVNPLGSGNFLHDCSIEEFAELCNDKLIGIWSHPEITNTFSDPEAGPYGTTRPAVGIDYNGHGSHTASTAAGNILYDVDFTLPAIAESSDGIETGIILDEVSGVAPHANIISYQACQQGQLPSLDKYVGCSSIPLLAAIEQAIIDGVDVLNYSISGGADPYNDDVELAFLAAHQAGVNVAASAGNSGSYRSVQHVSPWLLSVASTTTGRTFQIDQTSRATNLSGGTSLPTSWRGDITGTFTSEISGPVVLAENFGNEFCEDEFSTTFYNNEIVFCARSDADSTNGALMDKVARAQRAGAAAVVVYNTPNSNQELYHTIDTEIPLGMMPERNGQEFVDWLRSGSDHYLTIPMSENSIAYNDNMTDAMSIFSSIGPAPLNEYREAPAPGIAAPGSDIYAANATDQPFTYAAQAAAAVYGPSDFIQKSGTSMASPHIAGAMALVRQAHPDWTPSEVMSALQLTANDHVRNAVGRFEGVNDWFYGSGIAQVDKAINTGLIMNVPTEHYEKTNPYAGGNLGALNTPNMVDERCFYTCTWVREVTATVDGTWTAQGVTEEYSVGLDIEPKQFTLQKGETQRLTITGSWQNAQSLLSSARGATVFAHVELMHENPAVPVAQMNVQMALDSGSLPEIMEFTSHSDSPTFRITDQTLGNAPAPQLTVYKPVEATEHEFVLKELESGSGTLLFPSAQDVTSEGVEVTWVDVPQNAVRFIAEGISSGPALAPDEWSAKRGNLGIYVGYDANGDGQIQYDDEVMCYSVAKNLDVREFCNIPYPEAGKYWVVWQEHNRNLRYYNGREESSYPHKVATAVVTDEVSMNASTQVSGPSKVGDLTDMEVRFYDLQQDKGGRLYSALEVGTDANNLNNLGVISLNINRGDDLVSFRSNKARAIPGDMLQFELDVLPNISGGDRSFTITGELPEGLNIEEVKLTNNKYITGEIEQDGNTFVVSGMQTDSLNRPARYEITNSLTDMSCKTPVGEGGYVDLYSYGIQPIPTAPVMPLDGAMQLPFDAFYPDAEPGEQFALFHNYDFDVPSDNLYIHPTGAIDFNAQVTGSYRFASDNTTSPAQMMGVFWYNRFNVFNQEMAFGTPYAVTDETGAPLPADEVSGISVTRLVEPSTNRGTHLIIEWDNLQHLQGVNGCTIFTCGTDMEWEAQANSNLRADAQAIIARNYDHSPGAYEIIYAYDNLNFDDWNGNGFPIQANFGVVEFASAGVRGFKGPMGIDQKPFYGWTNQSIVPWNDNYGLLDEFLEDDMVVCMDYNGPEVTAFSVEITASSEAGAIGQTLDVNVEADIQGEPLMNFTQNIGFPSNITLFEIADQHTIEEEAIEGIRVDYMDDNNVSNTISVEGVGISATVNGHTSGSTIDIMPNENFSGETLVTVTVSDNNFPTDAQTTSFVLMVENVNDAPTVTATASNSQITQGSSVTLNANAADVDDDQLTYQWEGPGSFADSTSASTQVSGLSVGSHTFTVTVSDGSEEASSEVSVTVNAADTETESGGSSSGSFGWFMLLLPFVWLRRKLA